MCFIGIETAKALTVTSKFQLTCKLAQHITYCSALYAYTTLYNYGMLVSVGFEPNE